jgi:hypothetical protein
MSEMCPIGDIMPCDQIQIAVNSSSQARPSPTKKPRGIARGYWPSLKICLSALTF